MAVDPSLSFAYKGIEVPNQLAQYAQLAQLQNMQQSGELNALKMQELRAVNQQRNEARQLDPTSPEYESKLFKIDPSLGIQYRKEKTAADQAAATTQETKLKVAAKTANEYRGLLQHVNTPEQAAQWVQSQYTNPYLAPVVSQVPIEQAIGGIPTDPEKFQVWKNQNALGMEEWVKRNTMTAAEKERVGLEKQRVGFEQQRVGLEGRRVNIAEEEAKIKREGLEGISPKDLQKREAALPAATSALKGFDAKSDSFVKDLKALRDDPGLENITGPVYGRTPSVSAAGSRAQALYDKITAKGGFQALQDLRDASKTGGALGNVSNQEGKQLAASFAAIDRRQNAADVKAAIDQAIADIEGAKTRTREAYDATYSYKTRRGEPSAPAVPAAPNVIDFGSLK